MRRCAAPGEALLNGRASTQAKSAALRGIPGAEGEDNPPVPLASPRLTTDPTYPTYLTYPTHPTSPRRPASIDEERAAGHERRGVGREKQRGAREFVQLAPPA